MPRVSKKKACLLSNSYAKGHTNVMMGKSFGYDSSVVQHSFVRLPEDDYQDRISQLDEVLTFQDVDGSPTSASPLRPRTKTRRRIEEYTNPESDKVHPDLLTNKIYRPLELCIMFNKEIRKHLEETSCHGFLMIDTENSRNWGFGSIERLKCVSCSYVSIYYKLYEELETGKRGRKPAKINVGLQTGLMTTPISNTGMSRILAHANIAPPNVSAMNRAACNVSEAMAALNEKDMHDIRDRIKQDNRLCGLKDETKVNVEGDTCYNNPLFNSGHTPFQAGTIAVTTMCENNTRSKRIIGVHIANKLCMVASRLRNRGIAVDCPNHDGQCTANVCESEVIGNEEKWNEQVARKINTDLNIASFTGDGDSKGHSGVDKAQVQQTVHFKDLRHLGNSLKRAINKAQFSRGMFAGPASKKANLQNRFALSIRARCMAEMKRAHTKYKGNIKEIKNHMPKVISSIILCYKGYCGTYCSKHSLACRGSRGSVGKNKPQLYMPENSKLKMTLSDEALLKACIQIVLGSDSIDSTRLQTSTQKCEAVNRAYQTAMPKTVTFSRNCTGRIHSTILKLNHGLADSAIVKSEFTGAHLTKGSRVIAYLLKSKHNDMLKKTCAFQKRRKAARYLARTRRYGLHSEIHYSKGLTDPKPDFSDILQLNDHTYS